MLKRLPGSLTGRRPRRPAVRAMAMAYLPGLSCFDTSPPRMGGTPILSDDALVAYSFSRDFFRQAAAPALAGAAGGSGPAALPRHDEELCGATGCPGAGAGEREALGLVERPGPQVVRLDIQPDAARAVLVAGAGERRPEQQPPQAGAAPSGINGHPAQLDGLAAASQASEEREARQPTVVVGHDMFLTGVGQGALVPGEAGLAQPHRGVRARLQSGHLREIPGVAGTDAQHADRINYKPSFS